MANLTVMPRLVSWSYSSRTLCCAWATAMPYPGMTTTWFACSSSCAAPSTVSCFHVFCSPVATAFCTVPNAPNSTLVNERFIARHIIMDRIRRREPDDGVEGPSRPRRHRVDDDQHAQGRRERQHAHIDDVLPRIGHRALRDPLDFLQLARGHEAP